MLTVCRKEMLSNSFKGWKMVAGFMPEMDNPTMGMYRFRSERVSPRGSLSTLLEPVTCPTADFLVSLALFGTFPYTSADFLWLADLPNLALLRIVHPSPPAAPAPTPAPPPVTAATVAAWAARPAPFPCLRVLRLWGATDLDPDACLPLLYRFPALLLFDHTDAFRPHRVLMGQQIERAAAPGGVEGCSPSSAPPRELACLKHRVGWHVVRDRWPELQLFAGLAPALRFRCGGPSPEKPPETAAIEMLRYYTRDSTQLYRAAVAPPGAPTDCGGSGPAQHGSYVVSATPGHVPRWPPGAGYRDGLARHLAIGIPDDASDFWLLGSLEQLAATRPRGMRQVAAGVWPAVTPIQALAPRKDDNNNRRNNNRRQSDGQNGAAKADSGGRGRAAPTSRTARGRRTVFADNGDGRAVYAVPSRPTAAVELGNVFAGARAPPRAAGGAATPTPPTGFLRADRGPARRQDRSQAYGSCGGRALLDVVVRQSTFVRGDWATLAGRKGERKTREREEGRRRKRTRADEDEGGGGDEEGVRAQKEEGEELELGMRWNKGGENVYGGRIIRFENHDEELGTL